MIHRANRVGSASRPGIPVGGINTVVWERYLPGEWPSEDTVFDPTGAVDISETPPSGEEPPSHPSPDG